MSPRRSEEEIDTEAALSTGPAGEFLRRSTHGYFFADIKPIGAPEVPKPSSLSSTPFIASLKPEDARGWAFIAMIALGALLVMLGLMTVVNKGPTGWVPVFFGLALMAVPIVITAQKRRTILAQEEKVRAEYEERDRRNREAMASYATALERLRQDPSDASMNATLRERENLELSYKIWRPIAKRSILHIGFDALSRLGPERAAEVAQIMDRTGAAAGLDRPDIHDVKLDLYQAVVWHLLADDRLGAKQREQLGALRTNFLITDEDSEDEGNAMEQFNRLRGIKRDTLPKQDCTIQLGFRENCIHITRGESREKRGNEPCTLYLTNKRVIIEGKRTRDVTLPRIDDVEVDVNANVLTIQVARPDPPLLLTVAEPLYTAALIDIATTIDERPRSFT